MTANKSSILALLPIALVQAGNVQAQQHSLRENAVSLHASRSLREHPPKNKQEWGRSDSVSDETFDDSIEDDELWERWLQSLIGSIPLTTLPPTESTSTGFPSPTPTVPISTSLPTLSPTRKVVTPLPTESTSTDSPSAIPTDLISTSTLPPSPTEQLSTLLPTETTTTEPPSITPTIPISKPAPTNSPTGQSSSLPASESPTLPLQFEQWEPIGSTVEGKLVALSGDGQVLAVSVDDVGVRVYFQDGSEQIGDTVESPPIAPDDNFLSIVSIALSENGSRLAVATRSGRNSPDGGTQQRRGTIRVFDLVENQWQQIGNTIEGEPLDQLGYSTSFSLDGSTLAAGSPYGPGGNGEGYVLVLNYNASGEEWSSYGGELVPEGAEEDSSGFGWSSELSADGRKIVVGQPYYNTFDSTWVGRAFVFSYNEDSGSWMQLAKIDGEIEYDQFGIKVSISGDGETIAVDSVSSVGVARGLVKVYRYQALTATFEQIGDTLQGNVEPNIFGEDLDLSEDGNIIAIGDKQVQDKGYVRIVRYDGTGWQTTGEIFGATDGSQGSLGQAVEISNDGAFVALGFTRYPARTDYVAVYAPVS